MIDLRQLQSLLEALPTLFSVSGLFFLNLHSPFQAFPIAKRQPVANGANISSSAESKTSGATQTLLGRQNTKTRALWGFPLFSTPSNVEMNLGTSPSMAHSTELPVWVIHVFGMKLLDLLERSPTQALLATLQDQ